MTIAVDPRKHINFAGQDWHILKLYLQQVKETKIGLLIQESDHDKSNQIRGSLALVQQLLALEKQAAE